MVATTILLQEPAAALERLTPLLAGLDGSDEERVLETSARAGQMQAGTDYVTALYLAEMVEVLTDEQQRISELEKSATKPARTQRKK